MEELQVVLTTAPSAEVAATLGRQFVQSKLAACVNIVPSIRSIFSWEGKLEDTSETLLVIKTMRSKLHQLEAALKAAHPYDVPEFVVVPASYVSESYLKWAVESTSEATTKA